MGSYGLIKYQRMAYMFCETSAMANKNESSLMRMENKFGGDVPSKITIKFNN